MSLIEKIDAEIALTNEEKNKFLKLLANSKLPKGSMGESLNGGIMYVIHQVSAMPTHESILSEQKEPCECEIAIPIDEWTEDDGDCLWWFFPIIEPPYCGSPLDLDWQERDYREIYTHFTRFHEPINQPSTDEA